MSNHYDEIQAALAENAMLTKRAACDCEGGDDQCPDCHPDCPACNGKGYFGFGLTCDTCQGMRSLGWTQSEIETECERQGERAAQEGY